MAKRMMSRIIISVAGIWALAGCDNSADVTDKAAAEKTSASITDKSSSSPAPKTAENTIDWTVIASGETAADLNNYQYPFALDSQNVRNYAEYFKVDNATAQHNLTVGMASSEALSKVLDQLSTNYVSHELNDGKTIELVIHTTPNIEADSYDYVLSGDFGKGLILPIVIKPVGKKGDVEGHGES